MADCWRWGCSCVRGGRFGEVVMRPGRREEKSVVLKKKGMSKLNERVCLCGRLTSIWFTVGVGRPASSSSCRCRTPLRHKTHATRLRAHQRPEPRPAIHHFRGNTHKLLTPQALTLPVFSANSVRFRHELMRLSGVIVGPCMRNRSI